MSDVINSSEWVNWIEEAITKDYFRYYEYEYFSNIEKVGSGGFGVVYRANWKSSPQYLALKSFSKLDKITIKEIVHELKLQRHVDFHCNIIRFYGITKSESENDQLKKYWLVMEYANGGTLRDYLKEHFNSLTWEKKYELAYQLACAILCLHDEGIIHHDLHSKNVLVHQNIIKLADFGLSKRIDEASNPQSKLYGIIPYTDPKVFNRQRNNSKKSDIYSIGILLWEISSGQPPFYNKQYDNKLALEILNGLREKPVSETPEDYKKIYIECWNSEPDNRPTTNQVVDRLKAIITKTNIELSVELPSTRQEFNTNSHDSSSSIDDSLHGKLSQVIHNFDKMDTDEITKFLAVSSGQINNKNIAPDNDFIIRVDELVDLIFKLTNKEELKVRIQNIFDYLDNYKINSMEIYNWLSNDQKNSNSIFLLGYFNYYGIIINENNERAFNLFLNASEQSHTLAQYYIGLCYEFGDGTTKNIKLAFEYYKKIVNKDCVICVLGEFKIGYFNHIGIWIEKNIKQAIYWYEKAANNGNTMAQNNLASIYEDGEGVDKNYKRAFELYQTAANNGNSIAQSSLASMYRYGKGVNKDYKKAFELYQKAVNNGNTTAQSSLASMYHNGKGVDKNYKKAFELYQKAVSNGNTMAQNNLGLMYQNGEGVNKNYNKAFKLYQKAANNGNILAQSNLASMYYNGEGVNKDYNEAFKLYQKAANSGNTLAQYNLALMYKNGEGVNKNYNKAFELYQKAANNGNTMAQNNLALMYEYGEGADKDDDKAFELYQKAASSGNTMAQNNLASMYKSGKGVDKDYKMAFELYQKAANDGNISAQNNLALMYENGEGVDKNYNKAFELYQKAANNEDISAQYNLALMYEDGRGINKNYNNAFELYQKAANLGLNKAKLNLASMYENGKGIAKDINQAIYWYEEFFEQGEEDQDAQKRLIKLLKLNRRRSDSCKIN